MIQVAKDIYGRDFEYLAQGKVKGRNTLAKMGFVICDNPDYMRNGERYFHYNRIKGAWLGDSPVYTDSRALIA